MSVIDLTDEVRVKRPLVGMVTRFPPSESASAPASLELTRHLQDEYGFPVDVIRLVTSGETAPGGDPVVMDLDAGWHLSAGLAARRVNRCDAVIVQVDRHIPLALIEDLLVRVEIPAIISLDEVGAPGSDETRRLAGLAADADVTVVPSDTARRRLESEISGRARIEVIPHGSEWSPFARRKRSRRNILSWGFITPGMGAERVLRSMALLGDLRPSPRYRLVGVGDPGWSRGDVADYRLFLASEADRLGLGDSFEMIPILHGSEGLRREIEWSDLIAVVYDSRDRACSRVLCEAVSTARPVVATEFPGAVELLSTGEGAGAGAPVPHDDDQALAAALRSYLTDDEAYVRASAAGSRSSAALSWSSIARQYATLVSQEVGRQGLLAETRP